MDEFELDPKEPSIDIKMANPWIVESLYDFSYFCCPECETRWQGKQEFIDHAYSHHPKSANHLQDIKDGSIEDIKFPEQTDIKLEDFEDINNGLFNNKFNNKNDKNNKAESLMKVLSNPGISIKTIPKEEQDEIKEELFESALINDFVVDDDGSESDQEDNNHVDLDQDEDEEEGDIIKEEEEKLKCILCKTVFDTKEEQIAHECSTKPPSEELSENNADGKTKPGFTCDSCDFTTKNPRFLVAHVKNIHKKKKKALKCSDCHEQFSFVHQLKLHLMKAHKLPPKKPEPCLCGICGKTLIGRSNLKKHEREKHGIDNAKFIRKDKVVKIQCLKCHEQCDNPMELNNHVITCTNESKQFKCTVQGCDSKWASGQCLNVHLKVDHKMTEIHTCETCGKCLKKKVSLASHIKVDHENIKDHVCHLCGRGFARQQGLQFHIKRVHENTGKHFCDRCTFKAITKPELEIHINEVHTKAIKFHCSDCNFFCYRKGGLAAHVKNVHLKLRPHRCEVCGQAFVRRKELEKHKEWANHG